MALGRPAPLPGAAAGWMSTALVTLGAAVAGVATTGLASGLALALAAVAGLRLRRAAPLLALGPAALFGAAAAYVLAVQVRRSPPWGFSWPTSIDAAHPVATTAVLLLVLGVVVDRVRTGTWLPVAPPEPAAGDQAGMVTEDPPEAADR